MTAATYNIKLTKGVYWSSTFTFKDSNGTAINLTGYTWKAEVRRSADEESEASFSITETNPSSGIITLSMAGSVSENIPAETLLWDLVAKDSTNKIRRYVKGKITTDDTVTDPTFS